MGDSTRGLYSKFVVTRTDGKSESGQKHHDCQYFVLDVDHDPHARKALTAYMKSCEADYPLLAADIRALLYGCAFGGTPTAELGRAATEKPACDCEGPQKIGPGYHAPYCATMAGTEFAKKRAPAETSKPHKAGDICEKCGGKWISVSNVGGVAHTCNAESEGESK